jgi:hypothetical protein
MSKNYRSILTILALVLLIIGMGFTEENQVAKANSLVVESAQTDDEPESPGVEDEECYCEDYEFEEVEPPAELIPGYLPAGYEIDGAYSFDAAEFEEEAIWFVPGKGTAISLEFYGSGEEDFLEIIASDSPYATLEEWVAEVSSMEFEDDVEGEADGDEEFSLEEAIISIKGVSVLLEDWTDEYGIFSSATFIHAGQFIVVEGTLSMEEMTKVIESLPVIP